MSQLKFELFITQDDLQTTFVLDTAPVLFGSSSNCKIKFGDGEPEIKALIQKEGDHLLVKIFDTKYPIQIGEKKFKTAKLKKSGCFKIGPADVILNIEEVTVSIEASLLLEDGDSSPLDDYSDEAEDHIVEQTVNTLPKEPTAIKENIISELQPKTIEEAVPQFDASSATEKTTTLTNNIDEDGFNFNIVFDEKNYKKKTIHAYADSSLDFSDYIDLKDETIIELPTPEIHSESKSECIHLLHMNNGTVLSEKFFGMKEKRVFLSKDRERKNCMKIHDCGFDKFELVFNRDGKTSVVALDGYEFQKIVNDEVVPLNHKTVHLNKGERVVLSKGTSQIIIQLSKTPPLIRHNSFFNTDEKLLTSLSISWAFALVMLAIVLMFPPQKQEQLKKQLVVVYKRKKVEKEVKKPTPPAQEVAKSDTKKATPMKEVSKPAATPKQVVVKKESPKKKKAVIKKAAKVKPTKKPMMKVAKAKAKPLKNKRKAKKVKKAKIAAPTPKKQYKFNFGSKMNAAVTSTSNTKLKSAKSSRSVDMASSMNSASSVTSKFNSKGFGASKSKVARFAAGGPSGKSKAIGTKGLSGKTRSTTAYIEANTKILGAMDPELIRKIMREFIPEFRHCYQRELVHNSSVAGVFDLAFQINARGKGVRVGVISKGKGFSKRGIGCLKRVVKLIKFPKPKGGGMVDVKQPMNFYKQ